MTMFNINKSWSSVTPIMELYFPAFFYYVDKCIFHITGEGRNQGIVYLSVSEAY